MCELDISFVIKIAGCCNKNQYQNNLIEIQSDFPAMSTLGNLEIWPW